MLDIVAVVAGCVLLLLGALGIGGAVFNSKPALLTVSSTLMGVGWNGDP